LGAGAVFRVCTHPAPDGAGLGDDEASAETDTGAVLSRERRYLRVVAVAAVEEVRRSRCKLYLQTFVLREPSPAGGGDVFWLTTTVNRSKMRVRVDGDVCGSRNLLLDSIVFPSC
jgi:hypothetical protein